MPEISDISVAFDEPRLKMTFAGRMLVRIAAWLGYAVLVAATVTLLLADIHWLFWLGVLLALMVVDALLHMREADFLFSELPRSGEVNAARYLSPRAFAALERAFDRSSVTKRSFFLELAKELLGAPEVKEGLARLSVDQREFRARLEEFLKQSAGGLDGAISKQERILQAGFIVREAFNHAKGDGQAYIERGSLFAALGTAGGPVFRRLLAIFSLDGEELGRAFVFGIMRHHFAGIRRIPRVLGGMIGASEHALRHRVMNRAWTSRPTPTLDRFGIDFTDRARGEEIGFMVGHAEEYERLLNGLSRATNPNVLLIGPAGIGKETIVSRLAFDIVKDRVPPALFDKRLVALELGSLVAGATQDELQLRLRLIVKEIFAAGNIILYIPDIHNLLQTSGTAYLSAADALMPVIMDGRFPVIGTTFPREYKEFIEPRSDFTGAFETVRVEEITETEAERILMYECLILESQYHMVVTFGAVHAAVRLAKKYLRTKFLPASAEEILKEALVAAHRLEEKTLGADRVVALVEEKTKIPLHEASAAEGQALLHLEERIHERLIGQDEAVKAVANALREYRSGLARSGGPIASFLFVGPTGVGKTELAKLVNEIQFGPASGIVRFDMTEYQDKQSFYRFIGSPDGQISGALTDAVLQKPYSLVLLDEFEKAYPDILNLFLQVLDDGRLTDNLGRTADFQNTIVIATSNAHSDLINQALSQGETMEQIAEYLKKKLTDVFRPELLNRFSKIIVFRNLAPDEVRKVADVNLRDLARSLEAQDLNMEYGDDVVNLMAKWGFDPAMGARPLRRVIEEKIRAPLAEKILAKEVLPGGTIRLKTENDALVFAAEE